MLKTNLNLQNKRKKYVANGVSTIFGDIFAEKAENAEIWDCDGKRYLDFAGGIGTLNTGHRHPTVMKHAKAQMEKLTHTAFQVIGYESYVLLAEKLCQLAPGDDEKKAVLFTTGAEAVENAVKIARLHTNRPGIIAFRGAFHGRTSLTMAMTGKIIPYKKSMLSLPGDIYHIPLPISHYDLSDENALNALDMLFMMDIEPERVAAIIIEPVQGEGGFYYPSIDFMRQLHAVCKKHGILLIADEVQSGFGRTGTWFAIEHFGVVPDLVTTAKSLSGGFPLSAVVGKKSIMDSPQPGALGGTFGGNPVSCAAALGVIEAIESENLLKRSTVMGNKIKQHLTELQSETGGQNIAHIRGLGGMVAFELIDSSGKPSPEKTKKLLSLCKEKGLLLISCGIFGNTVRFLIPLTISDAHLEEGLNILKTAVQDI